MTDVIDDAQRFEQMRRDIALQGVRRQARQLEAERGAKICIECFEGVEPERLAVCPGAIRCLLCQEAHEEFQRLFPGGGR